MQVMADVLQSATTGFIRVTNNSKTYRRKACETMTTQKGFYAPRPLSTSHEYPGYQFYAVLRYEGHKANDCLRYAALTVQNWLCERIRKAGSDVPEEICCVPAEHFMDISAQELCCVKLPYLEIVSLAEQGIWTLMLREPDPNIAARSYVTHVGLKEKSDDEVEFGVYIDVVDRDQELPEQDKAFRPQFVRLLFETTGMTLSQVVPLAFRKYTSISDRRGVARLKSLADDQGNQLPLIIFTHAKQSQATMADLEQLFSEMMKVSAVPRFGMQSPPVVSEKKPSHFMPYDADEFARHIYGFARAYTISAEAFRELKTKFNRIRFDEGDILIIEPKAFGGATKVLPYREGLNDAWYRSVTGDLQNSLQCYSKHKPYSFGNILFEDGARQLMRERELEGLRASIHLEKSDELRRVLALLELERSTSAEQARYINELRTQMRDEFSRGADSERHRAEQLEEQINGIKADNATLKASNEAMRRSFTEFSAMKAIAERVQTIENMPKTNEDVVAYFKLIFPDRLGFTDRGQKTAAKCDINPDMLWACLYQVAKVLVDLYRAGIQDIEKAFKECNGWELAPTEGAETRKITEFMNLRKDIYEGREISVEPHIKFPKSARKTGAQYQRLYYAYDPESRKIIVGYVGDHLENYLSLSFR